MKKLLTLLLLLAGAAHSQETVSFVADITQGNGVVSPTLTWSTSPPAFDCMASGDWSGSKGPSGSETIPDLVTSATFVLECEWPRSRDVTLTWTPPTLMTDGTPADGKIRDYSVYYGTMSEIYDQEVHGIPVAPLNAEGQVEYVMQMPSAGSWYFVSTAWSTGGHESMYSNEATRVVGDDEIVTETVGITVNPVPLPPVMQ